MDPAEVLAKLGGAARTRQLLEDGLSPFTIRRALDAGTIRQLGHGSYALPGAAADDLSLAVGLSAGLTCVSALARHSLPLPRASHEPHLAVARNFTPKVIRPRRARLHYQQIRPAPGSIASVADALDTAGKCLNEVWHLVAVDAALNAGLISAGEILGFRRCTKARRDFLLRFADARSEAPGETIARLQLVQGGFSVRPQAYIDGAGRVDIEVEGLLIVQVDGYGPHSDKPAFTRDRVRARAVIKAGRPQLSYAASELLGAYPVNVAHDAQNALDAWRARDSRLIVPSGERVVRIMRDGRGPDPSTR